MTEFGKLLIGSYIGILVAVSFAIMWWESGRVGGDISK